MGPPMLRTVLSGGSGAWGRISRSAAKSVECVNSSEPRTSSGAGICADHGSRPIIKGLILAERGKGRREAYAVQRDQA